MIRIRAELDLLGFQQPGHFRIRRAKPKLAIKPERTGLNGLVVVMANLIRIDGETRRAQQLVKQA